MLAEELAVLNADTSLGEPIRSLLKIVQRLEQDASYSWSGWNKSQLEAFLASLPAHCALVVGVWEAAVDRQEGMPEDILALSCVCEVVEGEVRSLCTFEALAAEGLPPVQKLEPGYEHAFEIMRAVRVRVAPVAWALFTDQVTWNEWLCAADEEGKAIDKGKILSHLAQSGRCVLLGSQAKHHHF